MTKIFSSSYKFDSKILILGSYHPDYYQLLEDLVQYLRQSQFSKVFLAKDLIDFSNLGIKSKLDYIYSSIEGLMEEFDYNIFILFDSKNDSVIAELTTFVKSKSFNEKRDKSIILLPKNYNFTIVLGLLDQNEVRVYRYFEITEIFDYCKKFILIS